MKKKIILFILPLIAVLVSSLVLFTTADKKVQDILKKAKEKGQITYGELASQLGDINPEQIDKVFDVMEEMGVDVLKDDLEEPDIEDLEEVEDITCEESETALVAKYFEFGTPTTSSTTDYTTLGKNVFATLYSDGITGGVCINDGDLFCLQRNDYDNSKELLKAHFGENSCTDNGSYFKCSDDDFTCNVYWYGDGYGDVRCRDDVAGEICGAQAEGGFICN